MRFLLLDVVISLFVYYQIERKTSSFSERAKQTKTRPVRLKDKHSKLPSYLAFSDN